MSAVHTVALALLTVAVTPATGRPRPSPNFLGRTWTSLTDRMTSRTSFARRPTRAFDGDPSTGFIAMAGLPTPPQSLTFCGGTMPFQTSLEMTEGELSGVLHDLRMGSNLNVFVYQIAGFRGICASTPFASGTGHAIRTDNDLLTSLTRTNSFGMRIQGVVQDAAGQSYRLNAELHDLIFPDGSFKRVVQNVHLQPVGP